MSHPSRQERAAAQPGIGFGTLLVPYDFSPHARAALEVARGLAQRMGSRVHLLHVVPEPPYAYGHGARVAAWVPSAADMARIREDALRSLREVAATLAGLPHEAECHVVQGEVIAETICELAQKLGADLIAMGTHGRTGLAHAFLGSVAERTLRKAPCPVLTVRAGEEEAQE